MYSVVVFTLQKGSHMIQLVPFNEDMVQNSRRQCCFSQKPTRYEAPYASGPMLSSAGGLLFVTCLPTPRSRRG